MEHLQLVDSVDRTKRPSGRGESQADTRRTVEPAGIRQIHLRDYVSLLLKRKWMVLGMTLVVPAAAAVYTLRQIPEYYATAVLQVSQERVRLVEDITVGGGQAGGEFYGTQLRLLTSTPLAQRVALKLKLWQHPYYGGVASEEPPGQAVASVANVLRWQVFAEHVQGTQLIQVSYSTPEPELSATLANTLLREYIAFQTESESGVAQETVSFIQEQIQRLERNVKEGETALAEQTTPQSQNALATSRLDALNSQFTEAEALRSAALIRLEGMRSQPPEALAEASQNLSILSARDQYEKLLQQQNDLSAKFGPDWPELQRVQSSVEEARRRLDRAVHVVADAAVKTAELEYESALKQETRLRQQVEQQRKIVDSLAQTQAASDAANMEVVAQRKLLEQLLRRQSEAGVTAELGERTPINARIVEEATPPGAPYKPDLQKNMMMATVAGLCLAFGLALFMEYWEGTIDTPEALRRRFPVPYLGMIPSHLVPGPSGLRLGAKASLTSKEMYLALPIGPRKRLTENQRQIAERFKLIRTMLLSGESPARTFLVTSPDAKSGKSFVACNLAISLAQLEKRVLLVDADLRIPRLHEIFRLRNENGLSNALADGVVNPLAFQETELDTLRVLTAGNNLDSPAERLGSGALAPLLEKLAQSFDYVILDSAPLLPVPDTVSLAKHCEEVLLIVRSRVTTDHSMQTAMDVIERSNASVTGVILNGVDLGDQPGAYHRSYGSDYGT
jgi:capsular exopolysaccharide synthesis family protein